MRRLYDLKAKTSYSDIVNQSKTFGFKDQSSVSTQTFARVFKLAPKFKGLMTQKK